MSINSNWSIVSFKTTVALMIICLDDLFMDVSGVLKSPTIIVLSTSPYISVNICFIYLSAPVLAAYMLITVIASSCIYPFIII